MERLIEEIPNFFTIWNVIFLAKAMGVTFLLTAIGCIVGFSVGGLLAIFRKTKTIFLLPIRIFIVLYTEIFRRIPFLVSLLLFFYVFQIIKISDNLFQIGIHITDVSSYIPINSELDLVARNRITSVYAPHTVVNMLPDMLSENICSLKENEKRRCI